MDYDNWVVDSIGAFTFLRNPECIYNTKMDKNFSEHACRNLPMSFKFLRQNVDVEEM